MTRRMAWTTHCDAPGCKATDTGDALPAGWTWISSTVHLDNMAPLRRTGRLNTLTRLERSSGSFGVHVCPDHQDVFAAHLPRTDSWPGTRGRVANVAVSCSCGANFGSHPNVDMTAAEGEPSALPERAWWRHLPDDLKQYARQGAPQ